MKTISIPLAFAACATLAGCLEGVEGTTRYTGPDNVIATNVDKGRDTGVLSVDRPAVAYTPDGCQVWYIDDGVEVYADNRYDPVSGLPICNDRFPPGTVVGNYQSGSEGIRDRVPGPSGRPTVVPTR